MLKVLIVGFGRIARRHVEIINESPHFQLAGIVEIDDSRALEARSFSPNVYDDPKAALLATSPDLTVICSESGKHATLAKIAMHHCKTVLVEKPMALSSRDAQSMMDLASQLGCRLNVVQQNRLNLPIQKLKRSIEHGELGKVYGAQMSVFWNREADYYNQDPWRGTWAMDGGTLSNQANHHVDLLVYLFGEPKAVYGRSLNTRGIIEADDLSVAVLEFDNGLLATLFATTAVRPRNQEASLTVVSEKGFLRIGGLSVNSVTDCTIPNFRIANEDVSDVYGNGHKWLYSHLAETWKSLPSKITSPESAAETVRTVERIYESAFLAGDFRDANGNPPQLG